MGYSQSEMASMLRISQSTYSQTERNIKAAPLERLIRISILLNSSIGDILGTTLKIVSPVSSKPAQIIPFQVYHKQD